MPFDKKLACLTNYQERRSFPWPLVYIYTAKIIKQMNMNNPLEQAFGHFNENSRRKKYNSGAKNPKLKSKKSITQGFSLNTKNT